MYKKSNLLFATPVLLIAILACASLPGGSGPASPVNVETIVAATFQALTQASAPPALTLQPAQSEDSSLLPHPLYFLNNDNAGLMQIYRLDQAGDTVTQLTFEPTNVDDYDVSMMDGSVVYVSNNQLLTINADGSSRSTIFDGDSVNSPVWSPNGETIAFAYKGLNFYSIVSGQSNRVLDDQIDDLGGGQTFPRELYWPESYSADGSKLVITLAYYEGASSAIYYPNGGALVRLNGGEGAIICCGDYHLTSDGSVLFAASPSSGMFNAGLWRVDTATGNVTTLLLTSYDTNPDEVADNPFLAADGQLYFFYASLPNADEFINDPPLQIVRSAADGVTGRTVLRPETFQNMNEALWAPDASFVIVANPAVPEIYQGGAAQLYYTDGQKAMLPLLPYAMKMKWGP
ncbi:MAG: hypothetical protein Q8K73_08175 [Anaerolineales bacterium]|nr:hypothetical protein [Anaerolineales bacterium]